AEGDRVDVVARLMSRRFGGVESLQLEVRDAAPAGMHAASAPPGSGPGIPVGPGREVAAASAAAGEIG
ncbi:MAG: hypothetical protein ABI555_08230, partial [Chloroflexota bacterium]